ncbi:alkaline phosphatase D family protein [Cryptosporangium phraense]|uniref:Alkaline phosphatase n=1 Tax=Cryptosporangium phraense TaxID=2593070 RepID=A0A545ALH4_9ACTN|nr:alkaline phosphatase D family protein [Cryptosporangium phraense]TQS42141.1 alkaline phosphatase [Cryptosporangium phraense]
MPLSYPVPRRRFLAAGLLAPVLLSADGRTSAVPTGQFRRRTVPGGMFTLGVASGDPLPDGVVLWTRLAPRPLEPGGGMPDRPVAVRWEIASDERFRRSVRRGVVTARPTAAHTVHVDVRGLRPAATYHYRFVVGDQVSAVGRTRTAPEPGRGPARLRFATASCQNWQDGFYTAYRSMVDDDVDFVAFLGDYIYEAVGGPTRLRDHIGAGQPYTLEDYRIRHAQYRTDPDLAAAHAAAPWIVSIDDHDVDDNWAGEWPADPRVREKVPFAARKAAAIRAYTEHLPMRLGPGGRMYRRLGFGDLATLHVLDTRSYRSMQPRSLRAASRPARTMTGRPQESWLVRGLAGSGARWNLIANQVMMAAADRGRRNFDSWDGYRAQRRRLLEFLGTGAVRNPVVLTGDQHATWVSDLRPDFDAVDSPVVAAEFVGTSITSGGDPDIAGFHREHDPELARNPHLRYADNRRGYLLGEATREELTVRLRVVDTVRSPAPTTTRTAATFQVADGRPGVIGTD